MMTTMPVKASKPATTSKPSTTRPLPVRSGVRAGIGNKIWQDDWLAPV